LGLPFYRSEYIKMKKLSLKAGLVSVVLATLAGVAMAQAPGITRTVVGKGDVSVSGREAVVARVEVAPGAMVGWHTHPGDEISYIMEGEVQLLVAGQEPRTVKAGESFVIPAGIVHAAHNHGTAATRLIGVYVVEKGKPLALPASAPTP
jgi:quercetin dioxygenase-like cupin family protein